MAVDKFSELLKRLLPDGRAWDFQENFNDLIDGISDEFGRSHEQSTNFYNEFNIIDSSMLAFEHSLDYLITDKLYLNVERQRIIVEYLNKDYEFKDAIEDFANFINSPIEYLVFPTSIEFGVFEFGDEFGDPDAIGVMELLIQFDDNVNCEEYNKIKWLSEYLKPPYLKIIYSNPPVESTTPFEFNNIQFGDEFGGEIIPCTIIS